MCGIGHVVVATDKADHVRETDHTIKTDICAIAQFDAARGPEKYIHPHNSAKNFRES